MDVDWCLTCNRHFDSSRNAPYCSYDCQYFAGPSRSYQRPQLVEEVEEEYDDIEEDIYHTVNDASLHYTGHDYAGISAWASRVPAGLPALPPRSSSPSTLGCSTHRPPELLRPLRPVPPTLCMTKPKATPSSPSRPILTPLQQTSALSAAGTAAAAYSGGSTSRNSLATESSSVLATPPSATSPVARSPIAAYENYKSSVLNSFRSWVGHDSDSNQIPASPYLQSKTSPRHRNHERTPVAQDAYFQTSSSYSSNRQYNSDHYSALSRDDHPSYRARGRKASRAIA